MHVYLDKQDARSDDHFFEDGTAVHELFVLFSGTETHDLKREKERKRKRERERVRNRLRETKRERESK